MPTPSPGCHFVPRWRTMILPARTRWPPDFLTPSLRPIESRPLRDEPPAFLCAMGVGPLLLLRLGCRLLGRRLGRLLGCWLLVGGFGFSLLGRRFLLGLGFALGCLRLLLRLFRLGLRRSLGWFLAVGQDLGDAERRQRLAMALLAPIIGAPFLLEDHDLIAELVL